MRRKGFAGVRRSLILAFAIAAFVLATIPLLDTAQAASDTFHITGRVTDSYGNPIAMATVALENGSSVQTGQEGNFDILASTGYHNLTISSNGRDTKTVEVMVGIADLDIGTVEMTTTPIDPTLWYGAIALAIIVAALLLLYMFLGGRKQDREEREKKK